jgi:hypothetical protein
MHLGRDGLVLLRWLLTKRDLLAERFQERVHGPIIACLQVKMHLGRDRFGGELPLPDIPPSFLILLPSPLFSSFHFLLVSFLLFSWLHVLLFPALSPLLFPLSLLSSPPFFLLPHVHLTYLPLCSTIIYGTCLYTNTRTLSLSLCSQDFFMLLPSI